MQKSQILWKLRAPVTLWSLNVPLSIFKSSGNNWYGLGFERSVSEGVSISNGQVSVSVSDSEVETPLLRLFKNKKNCWQTGLLMQFERFTIFYEHHTARGGSLNYLCKQIVNGTILPGKALQHPCTFSSWFWVQVTLNFKAICTLGALTLELLPKQLKTSPKSLKLAQISSINSFRDPIFSVPVTLLFRP